jgi:acyl carrier protein
MELNEFVAHFAEQFEETDQSLFAPVTKFRELEEWSSLLALSIIAMVNEEYDVIIKGDEMKKANTIDELYEMVKAKL